MKHLKSCYADLRLIFEQSISVKFIAEPLASFDSNMPAAQVLDFMRKRDFDVVGVRHDGHVVGFVKQAELRDGIIGDYLEYFDPDTVLEEIAPLASALPVIRKAGRAFVNQLGKVGGIITPGDLQKAPVRMLIFGLVSLIEIQLLRIIRIQFPEDSWGPLLSEKRLEEVKALFLERKRCKEETDLADCLQLSDKWKIMLKASDFCKLAGFELKKGSEFHIL